MKLTKRQLRRIIKEEKQRLLKEDAAEEFAEIQSDLMMLGSDIFKGKAQYTQEELVSIVTNAMTNALWVVKEQIIPHELDITEEERNEAWQRALAEVK